MAQGCLRCLKFIMCVSNFLCFVCGVSVLGLGVYMMMYFKMAALTPTLAKFNLASLLLSCGIIITCVSFLGFLGALKENRCLLLMYFLLLFVLMLVELTLACLLLVYEKEIGKMVEDDLNEGLEKARQGTANSTIRAEWDTLQNWLHCCGVKNVSDWGSSVPKSCCRNGCDVPKPAYREGCLDTMKKLFEDNFLTTGVSVIVFCIIEVLGMCFAMTLFCHISRSGLGYKL